MSGEPAWGTGLNFVMALSAPGGPMAELSRFEVYLDESPEPIQTLTGPPFRVHLEIAGLADGEHRLRVVAVYSDGRRKTRTLPFTVDNLPAIEVQGLSAGDVVQEAVDAQLELGGPDGREASRRRVILVRALSSLVVLGGVWVIFTFLSPGRDILGPILHEAKGRSSTAPAAATMKLGERVFTGQCAPCHGRNAEGVPGAFPPLASNPRLENTAFVVNTIRQGLKGKVTVKGESFNGAMPGFAHLTTEETAAVATYARNSFGNAYGAVSTQQVEQAAKSGAPPAGAEEGTPEADGGQAHGPK